jgi:hypothetical protein
MSQFKIFSICAYTSQVFSIHETSETRFSLHFLFQIFMLHARSFYISLSQSCHLSWVSSVSILTDLRLDYLGSVINKGTNISFCCDIETPTQLSFSQYPGSLPRGRGVKSNKPDRSLPYCTESNSAWSYISISPHDFVVCHQNKGKNLPTS